MTNDEIPNDERMTKPEAQIYDAGGVTLCREFMLLGHAIDPFTRLKRY